MAGNAFTNLNTIALSDNFRAWFDKTNEIVGALNPVAVYGVTPGTGITVAIDSNGIATVGLSLEDATTGDTEFTGTITFGNEVQFEGKTVDFTGVTAYGNIVRTINGSTGDVTLSFTGVNDQTSHTGDVLIKAADSGRSSFRWFCWHHRNESHRHTLSSWQSCHRWWTVW